MSRRPEICRNFLQGSCRFGSKCKFLHHNPQQQKQPTNPFGFGLKNQLLQQPSNRGGNYYAALADSTSQQRQQNQSQLKEHRCSDPRECKAQIKEDFQNEKPVFWRLTCYAHGKYLPNDVVGDVSFEELRAQSYAAGKQGVPFETVKQNERSMFSAKEAAFQEFLKNPYTGPLSGSGLPAPPDSSKVMFGKAQDIPPSPFKASGFPGNLPANSFESRGFVGNNLGKEMDGFSFGLGTSSTLSNTSSLSSFPSAPLAAPAFSFGVQSFASASPLTAQSTSSQSAFGVPTMQSPSFWQNNLQGNKGLGSFFEASQQQHGGTSFFEGLKETIVPSQSMPSQDDESVPQENMNIELASNDNTSTDMASQVSNIWLKQTWTLGEIPEDEPPLYARG